MNKKLYMSEIAYNLRETDISEEKIKEILYQAKDVIDQFDEEELVEKFGTPSEYMKDLLEMNNIEYKTKKQKYEGMNVPSFIIMGIGIVIMIIGLKFLFEGVYVSPFILSIIVIPALSAILIYKKQFNLSTVLAIFLMLYIYNIVDVNNETIDFNFYIGRVIGAFVLLLGFHIFALPHYYRKKKYGFIKESKEKNKSQSYVIDENSINVDMHFGEKYIKVTEGIKNVNVNMSFGSVKIDATDIINDTYIDINGSFGDVKIDLPFNAKVVDSTSISFGGNGGKNRHINGSGATIYISGNYKFGSISY